MLIHCVCVCACVCVCVYVCVYVVLLVFVEVMSRILDLDMEDVESRLSDSQMVVTVFQYAAYFLSRGG